MLRTALLAAFAAFAASVALAQVDIKQGSDRVSVSIDGKPFTDFFIGADTTKPYLHPLRTASGKLLTRSYPMEVLEGEAKDHTHHRGLWFTHGVVNNLDFWANEKSQKGAASAGRGNVIVKRVTDIKSGKKEGSVAATFEWQDLNGKAILAESRKMTFYSHPTDRVIDFDITLTATGQPAVFGDTKEGMFALRLTTELEERKTGKMTTADGRQGEKKVWGTRSPWVDYAGTLQGEPVGVAIFDHPTNPRHPTYWHSRAYGLFAANIFGVRDFENDKSKDGSLTLQPGESLRFRYRVVIHPGDAQSAKLADAFAKYAKIK
jgi:hypothetical protein